MTRQRGINSVTMAGNVSKITLSKTGDGRPAGGFWLCTEEKGHVTTWVRVNVFDQLADFCTDRLYNGSYAIVKGKLMNRISRQTNDRILELRASELVILEVGTMDGDVIDEGETYEEDDVVA